MTWSLAGHRGDLVSYPLLSGPVLDVSFLSLPSLPFSENPRGLDFSSAMTQALRMSNFSIVYTFDK